MASIINSVAGVATRVAKGLGTVTDGVLGGSSDRSVFVSGSTSSMLAVFLIISSLLAFLQFTRVATFNHGGALTTSGFALASMLFFLLGLVFLLAFTYQTGVWSKSENVFQNNMAMKAAFGTPNSRVAMIALTFFMIVLNAVFSIVTHYYLAASYDVEAVAFDDDRAFDWAKYGLGITIAMYVVLALSTPLAFSAYRATTKTAVSAGITGAGINYSMLGK